MQMLVKDSVKTQSFGKPLNAWNFENKKTVVLALAQGLGNNFIWVGYMFQSMATND